DRSSAASPCPERRFRRRGPCSSWRSPGSPCCRSRTGCADWRDTIVGVSATHATTHAVRYVALLRGVNVGKAKRIAMADLRALFEELGYQDVKTLLNSGNVVFTRPASSKADPAARLEKAIASEL